MVTENTVSIDRRNVSSVSPLEFGADLILASTHYRGNTRVSST